MSDDDDELESIYHAMVHDGRWLGGALSASFHIDLKRILNSLEAA